VNRIPGLPSGWGPQPSYAPHSARLADNPDERESVLRDGATAAILSDDRGRWIPLWIDV